MAAGVGQPPFGNMSKYPRLLIATKVSLYIVLVAGVSKIISAFGDATILSLPDPILPTTNRMAIVIAGIVEIGVALYGLKYPMSRRAVVSLLWLGSTLAIYKIGILKYGGAKPCGCLGSITDILHIPPDVANIISTVIIIIMLLVGALSALILFRNSRASNSIN